MLRYSVSLALRLFGNVVKGVFFAVHAIWPGLRFEIPAKAPALLGSRRAKAVPRVVWQTNYSRRVSLAVYANYLFNRLMAPTHEFRMLEDADIEEFVRQACPPDICNNYEKLQKGAAKADFWRLLTLYHNGGVYIDIDATLIWPLDSIIKADDRHVFIEYQPGQVTNYFIAAAPNDPYLGRLIDAVNRNISDNILVSVHAITGPEVLQSVLKDQPIKVLNCRQVCRQGILTNDLFQFLDRPTGKWHREERVVPVIRGQ